MADFLGCRKHRRHIDTKYLGGEGLELLAKHNGVRSARTHELHFLRSQRGADVDEFFVALAELFGSGVDGEHRSRVDGVHLFKLGVAIGIEDGVALAVDFLDPVLEIHPDASRHTYRGEENGGDAVGACNHRCDVDERDVFARLLSNPKGDVVHAGHP